MFRHVSLLIWKPETTAAQHRAVREGLTRLGLRISTLRDYRFGDDAALDAGNHDFAIVADFDDVAGYAAYRDDPEHQRLLAEVIRPAISGRAAVQFDAGPARGAR